MVNNINNINNATTNVNNVSSTPSAPVNPPENLLIARPNTSIWDNLDATRANVDDADMDEAMSVNTTVPVSIDRGPTEDHALPQRHYQQVVGSRMNQMGILADVQRLNVDEIRALLEDRKILMNAIQAGLERNFTANTALQKTLKDINDKLQSKPEYKQQVDKLNYDSTALRTVIDERLKTIFQVVANIEQMLDKNMAAPIVPRQSTLTSMEEPATHSADIQPRQVPEVQRESVLVDSTIALTNTVQNQTKKIDELLVSLKDNNTTQILKNNSDSLKEISGTLSSVDNRALLEKMIALQQMLLDMINQVKEIKKEPQQQLAIQGTEKLFLEQGATLKAIADSIKDVRKSDTAVAVRENQQTMTAEQIRGLIETINKEAARRSDESLGKILDKFNEAFNKMPKQALPDNTSNSLVDAFNKAQLENSTRANNELKDLIKQQTKLFEKLSKDLMTRDSTMLTNIDKMQDIRNQEYINLDRKQTAEREAWKKEKQDWVDHLMKTQASTAEQFQKILEFNTKFDNELARTDFNNREQIANLRAFFQEQLNNLRVRETAIPLQAAESPKMIEWMEKMERRLVVPSEYGNAIREIQRMMVNQEAQITTFGSDNQNIMAMLENMSRNLIANQVAQQNNQAKMIQDRINALAIMNGELANQLQVAFHNIDNNNEIRYQQLQNVAQQAIEQERLDANARMEIETIQNIINNHYAIYNHIPVALHENNMLVQQQQNILQQTFIPSQDSTSNITGAVVLRPPVEVAYTMPQNYFQDQGSLFSELEPVRLQFLSDLETLSASLENKTAKTAGGIQYLKEHASSLVMFKKDPDYDPRLNSFIEKYNATILQNIQKAKQLFIASAKEVDNLSEADKIDMILLVSKRVNEYNQWLETAIYLMDPDQQIELYKYAITTFNIRDAVLDQRFAPFLLHQQAWLEKNIDSLRNSTRANENYGVDLRSVPAETTADYAGNNGELAVRFVETSNLNSNQEITVNPSTLNSEGVNMRVATLEPDVQLNQEPAPFNTANIATQIKAQIDQIFVLQDAIGNLINDTEKDNDISKLREIDEMIIQVENQIPNAQTLATHGVPSSQRLSIPAIRSIQNSLKSRYRMLASQIGNTTVSSSQYPNDPQYLANQPNLIAQNQNPGQVVPIQEMIDSNTTNEQLSTAPVQTGALKVATNQIEGVPSKKTPGITLGKKGKAAAKRQPVQPPASSEKTLAQQKAERLENQARVRTKDNMDDDSDTIEDHIARVSGERRSQQRDNSRSPMSRGSGIKTRINYKGKGIQMENLLKAHHEKLGMVRRKLDEKASERSQLRKTYNPVDDHIKETMQRIQPLLNAKKKMEGEGVKSQVFKKMKCSLCGGEDDSNENKFHLTKSNEIVHTKCVKAKGVTKKRKLFSEVEGEDVDEKAKGVKAKELYTQHKMAKYNESLSKVNLNTAQQDLQKSTPKEVLRLALLATRQFVAHGQFDEMHFKLMVYLASKLQNEEKFTRWEHINFTVLKGSFLLLTKPKLNPVASFDSSDFSDSLNTFRRQPGLIYDISQ